MSTTPVYFAGIDIGSTASKTVVLKDGKIEDYFVLPTGWNGRETANAILEQLKKAKAHVRQQPQREQERVKEAAREDR